MQKLEAARSEPADVLQSLVTELKGSGSAEARSACVQRRGETFRARVKKAGHTYFGPQRLTEAEAEEDAQKLSRAADISVMSLKGMKITLNCIGVFA